MITPTGIADPEDGILLDALVQTSYAVVDAITAVAARHDLSLTLLRIGAILRDRTPTMSELAAHLDLDRSTITGLVDRAARRGLMRKVSDAHDGRSVRVILTETGQGLAATCGEEIVTALAPLIARLSSPQRIQLTRVLTAMGVAR